LPEGSRRLRGVGGNSPGARQARHGCAIPGHRASPDRGPRRHGAGRGAHRPRLSLGNGARA
jgi:hypothetical protein